jgi:uncharacterized protein
MRLGDGHLGCWMRAKLPALLLLLMLATPSAAAVPSFPALSGRVVDDAGILSPSTRVGLTEMLARLERETGQQVVVVTVGSLQGYPIEDFGYQLGRHWGIGQQGKNTGAILIVAPNERKVRIEVGYGLEGQLTDAASRIIIEREILPSFRRGDFNAGVVAGTASIVTLLSGDASVSGQPVERGQRFEDSPLAITILTVIGLLIMFLKSRQQSLGSRYTRSPRGVGFPPSSGFPGSGGFGGGGGFSGGGGSFGGGGASGSW